MSLRIHSRPWKKFRYLIALGVILAVVAGLFACTDDDAHISQPQEEVLPLTPGTMFSAMLRGISSGIGNWGAKEALGWLLSLTGVDKDKATEEMKNQLDKMNKKLDYIIDELRNIEAELGNILKAIQMVEDDIINNNENLKIADDINVIENQYGNLQYYTVDVMGTAEGKARALELADDILAAGGYDIDQKLYNIHAGIMGTDPGIAEGAMSAWTTTLIDKVGTEDLLNLYLSLEYYFGSLISTQSKGLTLMVEALHHRDNPVTAASGRLAQGFPGTAEQYLEEKFTPWMEDEVEEFLRCVDRLVVAGLDLRTNATAPVEMIPGDVRQIYFRADFLAAQVSSRHSFGLAVRLIGEPDSIQAYVKDNVPVLAEGVSMEIVPVGLPGQRKDVRLTAVEHWMHWPDGYTEAYMQWNWGACDDNNNKHEGFIVFNGATDVAVAKFSLPDAAFGQYEVTVEAPRETPSKLDTVILFDDGGKPLRHATMDAHLYGSAVIPIRHKPSWAWGRSFRDMDRRIDPTYDYSVKDTPPWARAKARLVENIHWYNSHASFNIESGIYLPVLNGMKSGKKQRVTCRAKIHARQEGGLDKGSNAIDFAELWWSGNAGDTGGEGFWDSTSGNHTLHWSPHGNVNYTGDTGNPAYAVLWIRIANHVRGSEGQYLEVKAWADEAYLFF